jgi:cytochrome c556
LIARRSRDILGFSPDRAAGRAPGIGPPPQPILPEHDTRRHEIMQRKWIVLAGITATCTALAAGLSAAQDEKSPLHETMEKIQKNYVAINKNTRNAASFNKSQKKVVESAEKISELAKVAKPIKDAVKKAKDVDNAGEKWDTFMDSLIKNSDNLAKVAGQSGATVKNAKAAYAAVKKTCSDCHGVFRVDEDTFK